MQVKRPENSIKVLIDVKDDRRYLPEGDIYEGISGKREALLVDDNEWVCGSEE